MDARRTSRSTCPFRSCVPSAACAGPGTGPTVPTLPPRCPLCQPIPPLRAPIRRTTSHPSRPTDLETAAWTTGRAARDQIGRRAAVRTPTARRRRRRAAQRRRRPPRWPPAAARRRAARGSRSRSSSAAGDQRWCTMHWKRAPCTRASLADAHQLARLRLGEHHLAGADAGEADESRPTPSVRIGPACTTAPRHADPSERGRRCCRPSQRIERRHVDRRRARVAAGHDHVEPASSPPARRAPPRHRCGADDLDPGGGGALVVDDSTLRRSEHDRRDRRLAHDDRRTRSDPIRSRAWNRPGWRRRARAKPITGAPSRNAPRSTRRRCTSEPNRAMVRSHGAAHGAASRSRHQTR